MLEVEKVTFIVVDNSISLIKKSILSGYLEGKSINVITVIYTIDFQQISKNKRCLFFHKTGFANPVLWKNEQCKINRDNL